MSAIIQKCRLCLKLGHYDFSIFSFDDSTSMQLAEMAMTCANVKIYVGDGLPDKVCSKECVEKLKSAYFFKMQLEAADTDLRRSYGPGKQEELLNIRYKQGDPARRNINWNCPSLWDKGPIKSEIIDSGDESDSTMVLPARNTQNSNITLQPSSSTYEEPLPTNLPEGNSTIVTVILSDDDDEDVTTYTRAEIDRKPDKNDIRDQNVDIEPQTRNNSHQTPSTSNNIQISILQNKPQKPEQTQSTSNNKQISILQNKPKKEEQILVNASTANRISDRRKSDTETQRPVAKPIGLKRRKTVVFTVCEERPDDKRTSIEERGNKRKKEEDKNKRVNIKCSLCPEEFDDENAVAEHILGEHEESVESLFTTIPPPRVPCVHNCGTVYREFLMYKTHIRECVKKDLTRPLHCPACDKEFCVGPTMSASFILHVGLTHFHQTSAEAQSNTETPSYKCRRCKKKLITRKLNDHFKDHVNFIKKPKAPPKPQVQKPTPRPSQYMCKYCGKAYSYARPYDLHVSICGLRSNP